MTIGMAILGIIAGLGCFYLGYFCGLSDWKIQRLEEIQKSDLDRSQLRIDNCRRFEEILNQRKRIAELEDEVNNIEQKFMNTQKTLEEFLNAVIHEIELASHEHPPFNSAHEGFAILKEEVDELWEEVKRNDSAAAKEEAIQVAAMAIRFLVDVK